MDDHVETLRRYNRWRRGQDCEEMQDPRVVGDAIDAACDKIERLRAELAECREEKKMTRFDPEEFELHAAQEYARKMARERDEARVMADKLAAELAACAAVLPGAYYMDQPDGGDVPVSEQLRRLAQDAERYRYLRRKVAIVGAQFHFLNLPLPVHVVAPIAAVEFDAVLDVERNARPVARPPTPVGWSDTDWIKHLHEQQHPLSALHINRGSMDAAADAYEAEYNAARGISEADKD